MTSSPEPHNGPLAGLVEQFRSLLKKPVPVPQPQVKPAQPVKALIKYSAVLYNLKKKCSDQAARLTELTASHRQIAQACLNQAQALAGLLVTLEDRARRTVIEQKLYEDLLAQVGSLDKRGTQHGDLAIQLSHLVKSYAKLVIELQVCIYKVHSLDADQAIEVGEQLLLSFQNQYQHLEAEEARLLPAEPSPVPTASPVRCDATP
ncbi:hypothetical protein [Candidatus Cyanaurora vandensis]|uniref:hypothetical protein n=1 Tax=Candidatus Cyanaurora vandensis TaxID=2714958 RepID=UPI00257B4FA2|nr:hypothetical protein [Candidatus Cyanaurora vandensis]